MGNRQFREDKFWGERDYLREIYYMLKQVTESQKPVRVRKKGKEKSEPVVEERNPEPSSSEPHVTC